MLSAGRSLLEVVDAMEPERERFMLISLLNCTEKGLALSVAGRKGW